MRFGEKPSEKPQVDHQTFRIRRRLQVRCLWISRELGCPEKAGGPRAPIGGSGTSAAGRSCGAGRAGRRGLPSPLGAEAGQRAQLEAKPD